MLSMNSDCVTENDHLAQIAQLSLTRLRGSVSLRLTII